MFLRGIREDGVVFNEEGNCSTPLNHRVLVTPWVDRRVRLRSTKFSPHTTIVEFGDVIDDRCISLVQYSPGSTVQEHES